MPFNSIEIILELDFRKREKAANWTQLATLKDAEHEMKNFIESLHGWFEARLQCLQWDLLIARLKSDEENRREIAKKSIKWKFAENANWRCCKMKLNESWAEGKFTKNPIYRQRWKKKSQQFVKLQNSLICQLRRCIAPPINQNAFTSSKIWYGIQ